MEREPEKEYPRHELARPEGGMNLFDEGSVIPTAFKEVLNRLSKKVREGEF